LRARRSLGGDGAGRETDVARAVCKTCVRMLAVWLAALVGGPAATATASPIPPTVVTTAASVTQTMATLEATVNPNGANVSECQFDYGPTTEYGSTAPCTPVELSGETPVHVSAAVTGLAPNTTYHFRIVATNPGGTSPG